MSDSRLALVTGGAGFIGSHLARRLLKEGWRVDIIDNLRTGSRENVPEGASFYFLDLSRDDLTHELPDVRYDVVFHLAAQSSGEISFDDPVYDMKTNCLSTLLLLDWCKKNGIKRFIYTSSMSIYGDQDVQPVDENMLPRPNSFYGVGKLASESYMSIYSKLGVNTTALRLFNAYGPGQNLANLRQGMVSIYMAYILRNEEVIVKGSPDRYRDLVYVDDIVEALIGIVDNPKTFGQQYNVGTGCKTTVGELIEAQLGAFGYKPGQYPVKYVEGTPGDQFGVFANREKIKNDTGWSASITLNEGLQRMVEWAKNLR
ncbi:MAG: NAD-dependent epimerase/dehydratase family protein [Acidobacteriota bacterium]